MRPRFFIMAVDRQSCPFDILAVAIAWVPNIFAIMSHFLLDDRKMSHIILSLALNYAVVCFCKNYVLLPPSSVPGFFGYESGNCKSGRSSWVAPPQGKFWENYRNEKYVNQVAVSILCQFRFRLQENMGLKFEILVPTNLTVSGSIVFSNKRLLRLKVEVFWVEKGIH